MWIACIVEEAILMFWLHNHRHSHSFMLWTLQRVFISIPTSKQLLANCKLGFSFFLLHLSADAVEIIREHNSFANFLFKSCDMHFYRCLLLLNHHRLSVIWFSQNTVNAFVMRSSSTYQIPNGSHRWPFILIAEHISLCIGTVHYTMAVIKPVKTGSKSAAVIRATKY